MSNRTRMIVAFVAGVAVGIGGLIWVLTRGGNPKSQPGGTSSVVAEEPKKDSNAVKVFELEPVMHLL